MLKLKLTLVVLLIGLLLSSYPSPYKPITSKNSQPAIEKDSLKNISRIIQPLNRELSIRNQMKQKEVEKKVINIRLDSSPYSDIVTVKFSRDISYTPNIFTMDGLNASFRVKYHWISRKYLKMDIDLLPPGNYIVMFDGESRSIRKEEY